jgi:hypothetical protein
MQDHEAVLALAREMEKDWNADLDGGQVQDPGQLQRIHTGLYWIAMLKKDHAAARRQLELVRELQASPVARLLTGVITEPYMQAVEAPGADIHAAFRALLAARFAALPAEEVKGALESTRDGLKLASRKQLIDGIAAGLDPAVSDGQLSPEMAAGLVNTAMNLEIILPLKDGIVSCLDGWIEAHPASPSAVPAARTPSAPLGTAEIPAEGNYFGQAPPGETPVPFASAILDTLSPWVEAITFSPDGKECFLGVGSADYSTARAYASTNAGGSWAPFIEPLFMSDFDYTNEPVFSPDGGTLTFTGQRAGGSKDLWTTHRTGQGWSAAVALPAPINSDVDEYRSSVMSDGTRYFGRSPAGLSLQVYKASRDASGAVTVDSLDAPVNAASSEGDPCIAPDGRFLVFNSVRIGGHGGSDLYVSFPDGRGGWRPPVNLGPGFNSPYDEYGANLAGDGKYLFFTRHMRQGNGIYWVAVSAIERLRP